MENLKCSQHRPASCHMEHSTWWPTVQARDILNAACMQAEHVLTRLHPSKHTMYCRAKFGHQNLEHFLLMAAQLIIILAFAQNTIFVDNNTCICPKHKNVYSSSDVSLIG